jgi:hypothetical protein
MPIQTTGAPVRGPGSPLRAPAPRGDLRRAALQFHPVPACDSRVGRERTMSPFASVGSQLVRLWADAEDLPDHENAGAAAAMGRRVRRRMAVRGARGCGRSSLMSCGPRRSTNSGARIARQQEDGTDQAARIHRWIWS